MGKTDTPQPFLALSKLQRLNYTIIYNQDANLSSHAGGALQAVCFHSLEKFNFAEMLQGLAYKYL